MDRPRLEATRRAQAPRYPTWDLVRHHPALLVERLPRRWRSNPRVVAALVAAALGTGGAAAAGAAGASAKANRETAAPPGERPVAVVLEHGEGRGAFGCVAVTAPAFLSEEEARQVVEEELGRVGLRLVRDGETVPHLVRPREWVEHWRSPEDRAPLRSGPEDVEYERTRDLVLDGWDGTRRVGYEFVSQDDYGELGGVTRGQARIRYESGDIDGMMGSSVSSYDYRDAAQHLAAKLQERGPAGAVGVFYEPLPYCSLPNWGQEPGGAASPQEAHERARADLRRQVQDFAGWLKAQGLLR